ncbi:hypothetical protein D4764_16G0004860 [Takifugu flavidus]|uniref:peptide-methionine (S)-S-oxide reductase n=1 Tax=Takifugu flavidus TaxID=433684 RepID=A0A5C6NZA7_9TELE|nr:hypothetical protein D4764_16G0004860 [Takifugu flavidus]
MCVNTGMRQQNDHGTQYRSAVYTSSPAQQEVVLKSQVAYQQAESKSVTSQRRTGELPRSSAATGSEYLTAAGFLEDEKTERGKTVGWEDGSECFSFPPLSSTSTLSRGVTSYLRPGAVSLAAAMARGSLSLPPSLSLSLSLSLGWTAGRTRECGAVVCAHMGAGEGERGSVMDRDRERVQKEERAAPAQPRL